jgi:antitoxin component YwqK of YwqJK toxin-antitoxin module
MVHRTFYPNGRTQEEGCLINNEKNGPWFEYYQTGKLKAKKNYLEGKKHGYFEYYNEAGELEFRTIYADGEIKASGFSAHKILDSYTFSN